MAFSLNGTRFSWNSMIASYNGIPFGEGLLSLDYEESLEGKVVYGSVKSGRNTGTTSGKYATSGSVKMLKETSLDFLTTLTALGLGSYGAARFTLVIVVSELGALPHITTLSGCRIKSVKNSYAEGVDELVKEFTLHEGFSVEENGMTLFSRTRDLGI